jgi:hypothetical protein
MKYGKVLVLLMAAALFATPALAGAGKGYGKQVLSRSETRQATAMKGMSCPMKDRSMGDHHNGKGDESAMDQIQADAHKHLDQGR